MSCCQRFLVSGQVQGVFFRASTQDAAKNLGLTGWVRNLPDGRVEVVACGEKAALKRLEQWLWQGPRHARVENVTVQESATEPHAGFSVRG
ncbi:MAG: acylphosphatase [Gammaproteobacteria bacterium]|nr:acylphosphatase [Gammaproteobacteria bacterium]